MSVIDYMKSVREIMGEFEFKAQSPQGHIITSKGWQDKTYKVEVTPLIPRKNK